MELLVTMPAPAATSISSRSATVGITRSHGCGYGYGYGRPCTHSVTMFTSLGSGANLWPRSWCAQKLVQRGAPRVQQQNNTSLLTIDVYHQQDEEQEDIEAQIRKQEHESGIDLKQWMHEQGLPDCKVALAEHQPWAGGKGRPIHYIVASEDLQVNILRF